MPDLSPAALRSRLSRRANQVGLGLFLVVAGYRYLLWSFYMRHIPLTGDEQFYHRGASILSRWMRGIAENETVVQRIVERGWFMPGSTFHILPARRMTGDLGLIRLWQGSLDLALLVLASYLVARLFGRRIALLFFGIVGLSPDTATQSFSLWGESHGSKVLIIALCSLTLLVRRSEPITRRTFLHAGGVGLLFGWVIYLRPSLLLQLGTAVVAVLVLVIGRTDRARWTRTLPLAVTIPLAALLLLAPWTYQVSKESGGFVLTTNTVDVNLIHAFSDPEDLEALAGGTTFADIEDYLRQRMEDTGESYVEALTTTRRQLLADVTFSEYLSRAEREVDSFLDPDETFLNRYRLILADGSIGTPAAMIDAQFDLLVLVHKVVWYPLALLTLSAMLRRFPLTEHAGFLALIGKVTLAAAMVQPWVSNAKFRHLGAVIPLMVLLSLLALFRDDQAPRADERFDRWALVAATAVQVAAAALVVVTVGAYVL